MLLSFAVTNFRSFRDRTGLSFIANSSDDSLPQNICEERLPGKSSKTVPVLRSVALFGPNGGGKSNFLHALGSFVAKVLASTAGMIDPAKPKPPSRLAYSPFRLDAETAGKPTEFEIRVLLNGVVYRYGFSVLRENIQEEWLFAAKTSKERLVFTRENGDGEQKYKFGSKETDLSELAEKRKFVRPDHLLLSVADFFNVKIAVDLVRFFFGFQYLNIAMDDEELPVDESDAELLAMLLRFADLGIAGLSVSSPPPEDFAEWVHKNSDDVIDLAQQLGFKGRLDAATAEVAKQFLLRVAAPIAQEKYSRTRRLHFIFKGKEGKDVRMPMGSQSAGTVTFLKLFCNILKHYRRNTILLCDEIESNLHPMLCEAFFDLFHSLPGTKAQLLCTTHNVPLLNSDVFRRDQICIVEKDRFGASSLVSLDEYTGVRKGAQYGKQYLEGRFGGLPVLQQSEKRAFLAALEQREAEAGKKKPRRAAGKGTDKLKAAAGKKQPRRDAGSKTEKPAGGDKGKQKS